MSIADTKEVWLLELVSRGEGEKGIIWVARPSPAARVLPLCCTPLPILAGVSIGGGEGTPAQMTELSPAAYIGAAGSRRLRLQVSHSRRSCALPPSGCFTSVVSVVLGGVLCQLLTPTAVVAITITEMPD